MSKVGWLAAAAVVLAVAWSARWLAAGLAKADSVKVYMVTLKGEFGRDVALTPMKEVMEGAKKERAEVVVVRFDCTYRPGEPDERDADPNMTGFLI